MKRQCIIIKSNGEQCKAYAMQETGKCLFHSNRDRSKKVQRRKLELNRAYYRQKRVFRDGVRRRE